MNKMTGEAHRALKAMHEGGRIEARRIYPHPYRYELVYAEVRKKAPIDLAASTIDALVTAGYVTPLPPLDWRRDRFNYAITEAGTQSATNTLPKPDDGQLVIPGTEHLL